MIRSFNGITPKIPESAFVSEAAYVVGDVELGEGASVWPMAVIRGDDSNIKIGANTVIQDNCVIHGAVTIGDNVNVGHGVVIHSRKIGNNCLIGNNATVLEDVEIGNFCVIAGGCVVVPRMKIPDNSFVVGVPAEIVGEVPEARRAYLENGRGNYVELGKEYKEQGL